MKQILIILGLFASVTTFAQSPRIKLNQITKDTVKGSVLISSPSDSGMVYSRDFYIAYGADTVLILYGDTLGGVGGGFASVLSDGVTITGDGTTGNELKVDTATVISTIQGLVDTLTNRGYLTANQTITLSGDVTGSGTTAITATVVDDSHNHIISNVDFLQDSLNAKANDSDLANYVTIAGTETITGAKTFSTDVEIDGKLDLNATGNSLFIGEDAGDNDNGTNNFNVGIGYNALRYDTNGVLNVGLGYLSLRDNQGNNNLGVGSQALQFNEDGASNVAIGAQAFLRTNSNNSIGIGYRVGRYYGAGLTDGVYEIANSILIGYFARPQLDSQSNQIVIGYNTVGLGSNTAIIGNGSLTDIYNGADNANFSTVSDARDKTNIEPLELGLNLIEKLNPVAFVWDKRDSTRVGVKDIGFIAQEFDGALYALPHSDYADFVKITEDGSWKLNLSDIYPVIVKAIQEQQAIIESQASEIEQLKTLITELSNRLTIIENN